MIWPAIACCIANAPTIDEPSHVLAGLHAVRVGAFHTYSVNPPLPAMIAAS